MNTRHIYYSCSSWLSYYIGERYYNGKHYAWCSPYFDAFSSMSPHNSVPPSSNPRDIYWSLKRDVEAGDRHSAKVRDIRRGIQKGAAIKRNEGIINYEEYLEIQHAAVQAGMSKFRPLILVIPVQPLANQFKRVGIRHRASPLSEEYIIENLPRQFFDVFEL